MRNDDSETDERPARAGFRGAARRGADELRAIGETATAHHPQRIGVEAATDMANRGISTVEEYFGVEAAPGYP